MGGPFNALAWLADRLIERGESLRAGDVVITGGLTRAVPLEPGDVVVALIGAVAVTVHGAAGAVVEC
jgi:2-keto-4-pentenoate hydratase